MKNCLQMVLRLDGPIKSLGIRATIFDAVGRYANGWRKKRDAAFGLYAAQLCFSVRLEPGNRCANLSIVRILWQ